MTKQLDQTWKSLSHKVLACVLVDDGAVFPANEVIGSHVHWFPPPHDRKIWTAVLQCLSEDTPPTPEAVGIRTDVPPAYLKALVADFNDDDNRHLVYNLEQLRTLGTIAELRSFGRDLASLEDLEDISGTVDEITTRLSGIVAGSATRSSDSKSVSDSAWREVEERQEPGIPTGLRWFDRHAGGLWRGMNYWLVAAYKQGKSTVMRNCVLKAASLNNPVGVFVAEGSRELLALDCQAMLAASILIDQGVKNPRLNGLFIRRHYWAKEDITKQEIEAIDEARQVWDGLPIHLWDTRDTIRNHSTLRYLVKRGRVHHGITSFWGDYSQLFGSGNLFDRQSATALLVQDIANSEGVAFCMLAQKNEESIKGSQEQYSAGVKGGGDAAAAADFLLVPQIDGDAPNFLTINLKYSRHTRPLRGEHYINPASGLIIDKQLDVEKPEIPF